VTEPQWKDTERALQRFADLFEEKGYYIERNLINLPKRYADTVVAYMDQVAGWIDVTNQIEDFEKDIEKLKGYLFDLMNQVDKIELTLEEMKRNNRG